MDIQGLHTPDFDPGFIEPLSLQVPSDARGTVFLIAHAERSWRAEEANSTRVSARANFVLSGILAIMGLKLYTAGKEIDVIVSAPASVPKSMLIFFGIVSMLGLVGTLALVLAVKWPKKNSRGPASAHLLVPPELAKEPWRMTERQAGWWVFKKTHNAAKELHNRNRSRDKTLDTAQVIFLLSVLLLFVALGLYAWVDRSEMLRKQKEQSNACPCH